MNILPDKQVAGTVLRISAPAVGGLSSQMVVSVAETAMVGRLTDSTVVLAALGLGTLASWALTSVLSSLSTGTHVLAARRSGEGDPLGAGEVLDNSLMLALLLGVVFGVVGYYVAGPLIDLFASDPAVADAGVGYLRWRFLGLAFFLFVVSYRGFFNGIGHTKVFLWSAIIINLSNILFDWLFVFDKVGFPAKGLDGAGAAYALANLAGCIFFLGATFLPGYRRTYRYYRHVRPAVGVIWSMFRISTPVSLQNIMILLGFLVFVAITGIIGTTQQAASQVVTTALFMSFLPCFGFGIGAQTLVGQSLGRGDAGLARRYGAEAAKLATYFTIGLGLVFMLLPDLILGIITDNSAVAAAARPVLQVVGATQMFYGGGIVLAHALQAAGATVYVMLVEVLAHWVIFLPISYYFGVVAQGGLVAAWLALPAYILTYTAFMVLKYRSDSWTHIRV